MAVLAYCSSYPIRKLLVTNCSEIAIRVKRTVCRNVECFGAPASMFFAINRRLAQDSWLDTGCSSRTSPWS